MTMMPEAALYLNAKSTTDPRKAAPYPAANRAAAEARPLRVLVVEDDPDTADSLQILLELLGYQVGVAYSGVAAVPMARALSTGCGLVRSALPGMDGFAVAAALRQEPALARIRLIAVSAICAGVRAVPPANDLRLSSGQAGCPGGTANNPGGMPPIRQQLIVRTLPRSVANQTPLCLVESEP